jgi:hypothetical protein
VVHAYLLANANGSRRPVQDAATLLKMDANLVSQRLFRARRMGLLPPTKQGRAAGGPVAPRTHKRR